MALEREFKYLVNRDWFNQILPTISHSKVSITQIYLSRTADTTVRIRSVSPVDLSTQTTYWFTTKTNITSDGVDRNEWEIQLTPQQVIELLDLPPTDESYLLYEFVTAASFLPSVYKSRYQYVDEFGVVWDLDQYKSVHVRYGNNGFMPLITAEVEVAPNAGPPHYLPSGFELNITGEISNADLARVQPLTSVPTDTFINLLSGSGV